MTDASPESQRTHGIVIFTAVLNFISVAFLAVLGAMSLVALVFGNSFGVYQAVTNQLQQQYSTSNYTLGLNLVFGIFLSISVIFGAFFLAVGIGLLKGKKFAWYCQVAASVLGLLGFPIGTVLNILILVFFFQQPVRDHFKV